MALARGFGNRLLVRTRKRIFIKKFEGTPKRPRGPYSGKLMRVNKWMKIPDIHNLDLCVVGFHFCKFEHRKHWIGTMLFKVEVRGERYYQQGRSAKKGLAREMRILYQVDPNTGRKL